MGSRVARGARTDRRGTISYRGRNQSPSLALRTKASAQACWHGAASGRKGSTSVALRADESACTIRCSTGFCHHRRRGATSADAGSRRARVSVPPRHVTLSAPMKPIATLMTRPAPRVLWQGHFLPTETVIRRKRRSKRASQEHILSTGMPRPRFNLRIQAVGDTSYRPPSAVTRS
jgi:hypothetical protein